MFRYFLFSIAFFYSIISIAGNVTISGKAEGLTYGTVAAFLVEDFISENRVLLELSEISSKGDFSFSFDLNETRSVIISINRVEGVLYAAPGESYSIVFPPANSAEIKKFDRTSIELKFLDEPQSSINSSVRSFNADYVQFLSEHFYDFAINEYRGSDVYVKSIGAKATQTDLYKTSGTKDSVSFENVVGFSNIVNNFAHDVDAKYGSRYSNVFFKDYVTYSMAELYLISGMSRNKFYQEFFMSKALRLNNPAFVSCFEIFYHDYFTGRNREIQSEIVKAVNQERSPEKLISVFEADSSALSRQIRTLVTIKGLRDIYFNKTFTRFAIEKTLENISAEYPDLKAIAGNTLRSLRKCKEGWQLEDFVLVDEGEKKWKLSEHKDKPIYFLFFASWNSSALKEMQMMKNLSAKYGQDIEFVAISMDESYDDFKKYLESHTDERFTFLYGSGDPLLAQKCNVFSVPYALMVDTRGVVTFTMTRLPSQGIQVEFDKIISIQKQNKQGPKTWKD